MRTCVMFPHGSFTIKDLLIVDLVSHPFVHSFSLRFRLMVIALTLGVSLSFAYV